MTVDLAAVVRQVETGDNPRRRRFEPGVYAWEMDIYNREGIVKNIAAINLCSLATAHVMFSESYGAYQMMGFNLWGWPTPLIKVDELAFRTDRDLQDRAFLDFITEHRINYQLEEMLGDNSKLAHFVTVWNGPQNLTSYMSKLRAAAQQLQTAGA